MRCRFTLLTVLLCTYAISEVTITEHSAQQIQFTFSLMEFAQAQELADDGPFTVLRFAGARMNGLPGEPMVPSSYVRLALPPHSDVRVSHQLLSENLLTNIRPLPLSTVSELSPKSHTPINEQIYSSSDLYPSDIIQVGSPYAFRGLWVVDITINPIQFRPGAETVHIAEQISVTVEVINSTLTTGSYIFSESDIDILTSRVLNFELAKSWTISKRTFTKHNVGYDFNTGDWFKIPITLDGVYRITSATLERNGIDPGSITDLATIQMFNYGGLRLPTNVSRDRPGDLNEIAIKLIDNDSDGRFNGDDEILFYGTGLGGWQRDYSGSYWEYLDHVYDTENYYLFTYNQNIGKRIQIVDSPDDPGAVQALSFQDLRRFEVDHHNILKSGLDWYWEELRGIADQHTFEIELPAGVLATDGLFATRIQGGSGSGISPPADDFVYTLTASINGSTVLPLTTFRNNATKTYAVGSVNNALETTAFRSGQNTISFNFTGNSEGCFIYIDYLEARFTREFVAEQSFLTFYYDPAGMAAQFDVSGMPASANSVWDITEMENIREVEPLNTGPTVSFQCDNNAPAETRYHVFANSSIQDVDDVFPIENSPNLRDPARQGQLLMICADEFYDIAAELESLKESEVPVDEQINTARIRLSDIYREFSSCVADPTAIRDFVKYARDNWDQSPGKRPEYVFLIGDGSYDYRNIELTSYTNRVPVFEITSRGEIDSRACDGFFTSLANTFDGLSNLDPQLAIGRLPANSEDDVTRYAEKLRTYSHAYRNENPLDAGWQSTITFVADDECADHCREWCHFDQSEYLAEITPDKFEKSKIYLVEYPVEAGGLGRSKPQAAEALVTQINRGTLILNYFGHGDPNTWAHEQVLDRSRDLQLIANGDKLPLWVAATCTWGRYDDPNVPSMAEEMVWSDVGGGIGVIAASRAVYANLSEDFVNAMFVSLFRNKSESVPSTRVGDAVVAAIGGGVNDQKYHIFGDPSLRLADPRNQALLDPIDQDTLRALTEQHISAMLTDSIGTPLTAFDGKALVRVFDSVDSTSTDDGHREFTHQGGTLFRGVVSVENGQLESRFIVPKSIKYQNSRSGRVSIYAWTESENMQDAAGYIDTLLFTGSAEGGDDRDGPEINFSIDGQPGFFDGDYVAQQSLLVVEISDKSGINLTGEVGHRIELTIDEGTRKDITQFFVYDENSFQSGKLEYPLPLLSSGHHKLAVSAWDNLNNYSEQDFSINTSAIESLTLAQVVNYPNPFSTSTQFTFQFQSPTGLATALVKIYTVRGRLINQLSATVLPGFNKIEWDGRDSSGSLVANGTYLYKILLDDGLQQTEKLQKLAIIR